MKKSGFALPVAFDLENLETCSFDVAKWRAESKPPAPKITLKFSVDS